MAFTQASTTALAQHCTALPLASWLPISGTLNHSATQHQPVSRSVSTGPTRVHAHPGHQVPQQGHAQEDGGSKAMYLCGHARGCRDKGGQGHFGSAGHRRW